MHQFLSDLHFEKRSVLAGTIANIIAITQKITWSRPEPPVILPRHAVGGEPAKFSHEPKTAEKPTYTSSAEDGQTSTGATTEQHHLRNMECKSRTQFDVQNTEEIRKSNL